MISPYPRPSPFAAFDVLDCCGGLNRLNALGLPRGIETPTGTYDFSYDGFGTRVQRKLGSTEQVVTLGGFYERRSQPQRTQLFRVLGPDGAIVEITRATTGSEVDVVRYLHRDNLTQGRGFRPKGLSAKDWQREREEDEIVHCDDLVLV